MKKSEQCKSQVYIKLDNWIFMRNTSAIRKICFSYTQYSTPLNAGVIFHQSGAWHVIKSVIGEIKINCWNFPHYNFSIKKSFNIMRKLKNLDSYIIWNYLKYLDIFFKQSRSVAVLETNYRSAKAPRRCRTVKYWYGTHKNINKFCIYY